MTEPSVTTYTLNAAKLTAGQISGVRWAFAVGGVLTILLGVFLLLAPKASLVAVAWIFAIYFLIAGIARIVRGVLAREHGGLWRVLTIVFGVLLLAAGVYIVIDPLLGIGALVFVIGLSWIVEGVASLFDAAPDVSRWITVLYGVISVVAGVFVLANPLLAAFTLLLVTAFFLIAAGVVEIIQAVTFGKQVKRAGLAG
ncbi:HdeD family acid-resistance protein [Plantibacter sp. Leaf314]|uniref:HdeD family acid-resistance protein n=1 Tax=Plantibacter sp. Leaf314 TaxID=1736333 RepID=UPI0007013C13|nr:DUF308 domain-containing protein [Plantibacter sp. Leaf314]KQQ51064.1 hypothetical protein ASF68_00785 [Plantibacter sp. Leaf314]